MTKNETNNKALFGTLAFYEMSKANTKRHIYKDTRRRKGTYWKGRLDREKEITRMRKYLLFFWRDPSSAVSIRNVYSCRASGVKERKYPRFNLLSHFHPHFVHNFNATAASWILMPSAFCLTKPEYWLAASICFYHEREFSIPPYSVV